MHDCKKLNYEESAILKEQYGMTNYSVFPLVPSYLISDGDDIDKLLIVHLPSHHTIGLGAIVIDNHISVVVFRENFVDRAETNNKNQTWIIMRIIISEKLKESHLIFGEGSKEKLISIVLKMFKSFKMLDKQVVLSQLSDHFTIEYKGGIYHGIPLR